ncbi:TOBE-like domain-containing protein [Corynebacterium urogenitale]
MVVERVTFLGFEVRVELHEKATGNPVTAEITRGDALALSLQPGDEIYARATRPAALQEWLGL